MRIDPLSWKPSAYALILLSALFALSIELLDGAALAQGGKSSLRTSDEVMVVCKNASGDGALIQAAVNEGKPVHIAGTCTLDSSITIRTPGQMIRGDGRTATVMKVSTILPDGAYVFRTGDPGPVLSDLGFIFAQPDVSSRSSLVGYSPAIYAANTPRFKLLRLRITDAMVGIDATGQSGAAVIDDLEESAFSVGIWLDGSLDTVRIHNWHFFPFVVTAKQRTIWNAPLCTYPARTCKPQTTSGTGGPVGLYSGRVDDLEISDSLFLAGQSILLFEGATGGTFGSISNTAFDTYSGISELSGQVTVASSYFSLADNQHQAIYVVGGLLQCAACRFLSINDFDKLAMIDQTGGNLILSNIFMQGGNSDPVFIRINGGGTLSVSTLQFNSTLSTPKNPKFCFACNTGHVVVVASGITPDNESAIDSGVMMSIGQDGYFRVADNNLLRGWRNGCPTIAAHGVFANNGSQNASTCN